VETRVWAVTDSQTRARLFYGWRRWRRRPHETPPHTGSSEALSTLVARVPQQEAARQTRRGQSDRRVQDQQESLRAQQQMIVDVEYADALWIVRGAHHPDSGRCVARILLSGSSLTERHLIRAVTREPSASLDTCSSCGPAQRSARIRRCLCPICFLLETGDVSHLRSLQPIPERSDSPPPTRKE
jgi:hypothetical protein